MVESFQEYIQASEKKSGLGMMTSKKTKEQKSVNRVQIFRAKCYYVITHI